MKIICFLLAIISPMMNWASTATIAVIKLSEQAFVLTAIDYGTNIGLLKTNDGIVLIDPMPGEVNLDALHAKIQQLVGRTATFILNTHTHADHTGGNAYFIAKGAVQMKDAVQLSEIVHVAVKSHSAMDKIFYHQQSNSIFVGDIYDSSWHPTFYAGGVAGFNHAIEAVLKLGNDNSLIVPGHGKATGKTELRLYQQHTLAWVARVRQLKNDGMTLHDMRHDEQLKAILATFNQGNKADFMSEKALIRFIERTIAVIEQDP
jgi:glyoxylase-like metal-dependent hydrolase (beta-lactamase superfamily II)